MIGKFLGWRDDVALIEAETFDVYPAIDGDILSPLEIGDCVRFELVATNGGHVIAVDVRSFEAA